MIAIDVENISKRFHYVALPKHITLKEAIVKRLFRERSQSRTVEALRNVTFSVPQGQMLGVMGRNGSGKTTLLRLLAGVYRADSGRFTIKGSFTPLLALGVGFHPDLTGRENARIELLMLGMSPREINARMDEIIDFSELGDFIDAPLRTYSTGMGMRLAFSAAISIDPDVLLLDEVLSVGDEEFARKCLKRVDEFRAHGKTIVLVTHQVDTVKERCDLALWLDAGRVASFGSPVDVIDAYHGSTAAPIPA